jgi:hypothetical protein
MGETRNAHRIGLGKPKRKRSLGKPVHGERNNIVGPGYQPGCIILRVGNLAD